MGDTVTLYKSSNELWAFLTIEKCLSISLKSESRPVPTPEHPQRKHPVAVGEWMESLRKNSDWSVAGLQSERGPGTAHTLFWPLGSPQWPPPPPLMDAGPLGSPYRHALFAVWRSRGGQGGWEDSVGKEDVTLCTQHFWWGWNATTLVWPTRKTTYVLL